MRYALPVVVNEVLWGLGTAANTAILGHMGSAAVAANFSGAGGKTACDSCIVWVVQRGRRSIIGKTIGEKRQSMRKHMAKRVSYIEHYHGEYWVGTVILRFLPLASAALTLSRYGKMNI